MGRFWRTAGRGIAGILPAAVLWLTGCSSAPADRASSSRLGAPLAEPAVAEQAAPRVIAAHVDAGARFWLSYVDEDARPALGIVRLPQPEPADAVARAHHAGPPIVGMAAAESPLAAAAPAGGEDIEVRPQADWYALVFNLASESAGLVPGQGVVLDVLRSEELFLYTDDNGGLQVVPLADKPVEREPALALGLAELVAAAAPRLRAGTDATHLLFNTGDPVHPFAVLELHGERLWFVRNPGRPPVRNGSGLAAAHTTQAAYHALSSQLRSIATRPVSTMTRLLASVAGTAVDTLPPRSRWQPDAPLPPAGTAAAPMDLAAWEARLAQLAPASATAGEVEYLVDGGAFFPALVHRIQSARDAIRLRLYIFDNDDYAQRVADLLKTRSGEIPVRILLDGLGTISGGMAEADYTPEQAGRGPLSMAAYLRAGSAVEVRMLPNPWLQGDHSKVLIFDDDIAFLGGMNIGREYRYEWHDLMVAVQGPVVDRLADDFERAWRRAGLFGDLGAILEGRSTDQRRPSLSDRPLRLLYTRPGDAQILRTQVAALRAAQQRVWIQNAYLTSDTILHELIAARRRGVDVRVILPYRTDSGFIGRSNVLAANLMLRQGIRVYIYPGMSHVKAAVYDGWACLGSANFDRLSLRLNRETNIATSDQETVTRLVEAVFEPDFARAVELSAPLPASWVDYLGEIIADQL